MILLLIEMFRRVSMHSTNMLFILFAWFVFVLPKAFANEEVPQSFTLDGRLYSDSAATIPLVDIVSFKIQILNPSQACILYEELQTINTSATAGYYTIQVGQKVTPPAGKRSVGDSNNGLATIFSNSVTSISGKLVSDGSTACSYTPTAGDARYLKFTMTPASDNIARTTTSNLLLDSVPMAIVAERAETLRGLTPNQFLLVNGTTAALTQANLENILSTSNYANLSNIIATPAANYISKNANGSVAIPSVAGAPGSGLSAGQIWYDSTNNLLKYRDNSGTQTIGTASGVSSFANGGNTFGASANLGTNDTFGLNFKTNNSTRLSIDSAGNVGIGNSAPSVKLQVGSFSDNYDSFLKIVNSGSAAYNNGLLLRSASDNYGFSILNQDTGSQGLNILRHQNSAAGSSAFYIDRVTGNIGLGTTAPVALLDISSGGNSLMYGADGAATTRTDATLKRGRITSIHYSNATQAPVMTAFALNAPTANELRFGGGDNTYNSATQLEFFTGATATTLTGTERMRIDYNGNVGIGTASPAFKLDSVGGFFHAGVNSQAIPPSDNTNGGLIVGWNRLTGGGQAEVNLYNAYDVGGSLSFLFSQKTGAGTASDLLSIARNGNVGIGTTTPAAKIHLAGNSSAAAWSTSGIGLRSDAATYTDTTSTGTVTYNNVNTFGTPTLAASSPTTYTWASSVYIDNAPIAGTNTTISNPYALWVNAGRALFLGGIAGSTNGGSGNFVFVGGNGANSSTSSTLQIGGATTTHYRGFLSGSTATSVVNNGAFANMDFGTATLTTGTSGAHPILANVAIKPISVTAGAATVTNTASLYVEDAASTTVTGGNFSIYSAAGNNYFGGNVGVGTTSPSTKLDIAIANANLTTTQQNVNTNALAISSTYGAGGNYFPGLVWYTTDQSPTKPKAGIWSYGDLNGSKIIMGTSNVFANGITNSALTIDSSGNLGIGIFNPSEKLHVVGNLRVQGSTDCTLGNGAGGTNCSSDIRLKNNVEEIQNATAKILSLRGVEFDWNERSQSPDRHAIGVIAQDVEKVFPTAVIEDPQSGYKKVDYAVLVAPLIQAFKEFYEQLNAKLTELSSKNERQTREIASTVEQLTGANSAKDREIAELKSAMKKLEQENKINKERLERLEKKLLKE